LVVVEPLASVLRRWSKDLTAAMTLSPAGPTGAGVALTGFF
jgi:hypothetical protein